MHFSVRLFAPTLALLTLAACRGKEGRSSEALADTVGAARRLAVITPTTPAYRVTPVTDGGRVAGTVSFGGTPQGDTLVVVQGDQNGCGKPLSIARLQRRGDRVAGVLVWIPDIHAGQALPATRRFELTNNDCAWDPVLQATVVGGTLNVVNYDPLVDKAFITNVATRDTVAIAPFTDNGQLIPYDKLLRTPGVYEFSMESRPMSRAWVAVLDQPYFAITDANGSFTIDGVPPGTYTVRAWHPMLGVTNGTATVAPNGTATVTLRYGAAAGS
jgi:hypothetical protein